MPCMACTPSSGWHPQSCGHASHPTHGAPAGMNGRGHSTTLWVILRGRLHITTSTHRTCTTGGGGRTAAVTWGCLGRCHRHCRCRSRCCVAAKRSTAYADVDQSAKSRMDDQGGPPIMRNAPLVCLLLVKLACCMLTLCMSLLLVKLPGQLL